MQDLIKKLPAELPLLEDGLLIKDTIAKAIQTKQGQSCWTKAVGKNSLGAVVSEFNFQWTLKVRS